MALGEKVKNKKVILFKLSLGMFVIQQHNLIQEWFSVGSGHNRNLDYVALTR